ncbi:MAG: hypothetical protein LBV54_04355 [Puniceicoccales bacterium]|jgi:tetratricopeptide (TPR) repeat protein|nr:hypothetical protein [Puniceicoccales bacterium]
MKRHLSVLIAAAAPLVSFAQTAPVAPTPSEVASPRISERQPAVAEQEPVSLSPQEQAIKGSDAMDVIFLLEFPINGSAEEVAAYTRRMYGRVASLENVVLRQLVRLTLANLDDNPQYARQIYAEHLVRLGNSFYTVAEAALARKDIQGAGKAIQLAVRCNPASAKARLCFAEMLSGHLGKTDEAITTLAYGLRFVKMDDPALGDYLARYFQLLEGSQRDREVAQTAKEWLKREGLSTYVRDALVLHVAIASNAIGDYTTTVDVLQRNGFKTSQATLLKARAYFYGGFPDGGIDALSGATFAFKGMERDAILAQLCRFYTELGKVDLALSVAQQRISEFPDNPYPRVHRLYLLNATERQDMFERELKDYLARFGTKQSAVLALATFASERGLPAVADTCFRIASKRSGTTATRKLGNGNSAVDLEAAEWNTFNQNVFASLLIESFIRARRPQDAIATYRSLQSSNKHLFNEPDGTSNALVAAAYFAIGDPETGRRYLDDFTHTTRTDSATVARVRELEEKRSGVLNKDGSYRQYPVASMEERIALGEEIKRISRTQRKISPHAYIAVGRLLRFVSASQEALRILENGARAYPADSQLKADYISVRIVCDEAKPSGPRKALVAEVDELLGMRRPSPKVWSDIKSWLDTDTTIPASQVAKLRASVDSLVRTELVGLGIFGV